MTPRQVCNVVYAHLASHLDARSEQPVEDREKFDSQLYEPMGGDKSLRLLDQIA